MAPPPTEKARAESEAEHVILSSASSESSGPNVVASSSSSSSSSGSPEVDETTSPIVVEDLPHQVEVAPQPASVEETESNEIDCRFLSSSSLGEKQASESLILEHEAYIAELEQGGQAKGSKQSKPAAASSQQKAAASSFSQAPASTSTSSYFSLTTGLSEVAFATSGRAKCYHCKGVIGKGTVRYSWFHSTTRPPGWLHEDCLIGVAKKNNLTDQALSRLKALSAQTIISGDQGCKLSNAVRNSLQQLEKAA